MARQVKMIEMHQMVALLNGLGGGASALVGLVTLMGIVSPERIGIFIQEKLATLFTENYAPTHWLTSFEVRRQCWL